MGQPYKILWVDDEPALREIMSELLADEGYSCTEASDGLEAIELLKHNHFDLIITDFNMPNMDGASLLFWCRKNGFHMPVIFVSANTERIPLEDVVLHDCCTAVINKPFSIEKLLSEIDRAKGRNHEYECKGKQLPHDKGDYRHSFPGQHYLSSET